MKKLPKIEVASCTVAELFSGIIPELGNFEELEIPEYQRSYQWGAKEIEKLLADIEEHIEEHSKNTQGQMDKPLYYLGNIILHQKNDKLLSIIDGQQRLITMAIVQFIQDKNRLPRIKYVSPKTLEQIKENHQLLKEKLSDSRIDLGSLNITLLITQNEDEAYTFFETQNTGGVRLSGIDIIKAHHLRSVSGTNKRDEYYAMLWEKQKNISEVANLLLKARRWNIIAWKDVPGYRDQKKTKMAIIEEFSEKTILSKDKIYFQEITGKDNYNSIEKSKYIFAIRQPFSSGENFIDYLKQFCELYQRLFGSNFADDDCEISDEYYKFYEKLIQPVDGTQFLKELFQISLLCFVNKFGVKNIFEASLWIFRFTYSLRVSNAKVVKENSIPAFLRKSENETNYIFDVILSCFTFEQAIQRLRSFELNFNDENIEENTVKGRFIKKLRDYFGAEAIIPTKDNFDKNLTKAIEKKIRGEQNE